MAVAKTAQKRRLDADRLASPDLRALLAVQSAASQTAVRGEADMRRMDSPLKINDFDVLVAIGLYGPLRPSELTRKASLAPTPTTVSSIVTRLEKRGLVTRSAHPTIGGAVVLEATDEGVDMIEYLFPEVERKVISWFGGHFSQEELATLARLLERI